jgi:hypothetical protein
VQGGVGIAVEQRAERAFHSPAFDTHSRSVSEFCQDGILHRQSYATLEERTRAFPANSGSF